MAYLIPIQDKVKNTKDVFKAGYKAGHKVGHKAGYTEGCQVDKKTYSAYFKISIALNFVFLVAFIYFVI